MADTTDRVRVSKLGLRLTLFLACFLTAVLAALSLLTVRLWERTCVDAAVSETERFSDTLQRSIQHSMMNDQREGVREIIDAVGAQKGVEWVRIFNKDGKITYSTNRGEIGTVLDRTTEACTRCHRSDASFERLPSPDRSRILRSPKDKHRLLATMDPIRSTPACAAAECHAHQDSHRVLGVLDIAVSLAPTDETIRKGTIRILGVGIAAVVLVSLFVVIFLQRAVGRPVGRLLKGTEQVAQGDFQVRLPVRGDDEIARLGSSFNRMAESLQGAYGELRELTQSLERRVQEKTRELQAAQKQAIRAEKLSSLGRMAAGVAHEINNPLTGVLTFSHLVARKLPDGSKEREDLDVVIRETNRCARIVRDLLQFARETPSDRQPADLNELTRQTLALLEHQALFHDIRIEKTFDEKLPRATVDASQIKQVLANILLNAAQAMPQGGTLTLTTSVRPADSGSLAIVSVADTGCGIAPENLGKIFDPFFTTREPGQGTGLGLSVSLQIVESHGGTIEVTSEVGRGSTFRVVLRVEGG